MSVTVDSEEVLEQLVVDAMSDSDLGAIAAFLETIPPIENAVPRSSFTPRVGSPTEGRPLSITARR